MGFFNGHSGYSGIPNLFSPNIPESEFNQILMACLPPNYDINHKWEMREWLLFSFFTLINFDYNVHVNSVLTSKPSPIPHYHSTSKFVT